MTTGQKRKGMDSENSDGMLMHLNQMTSKVPWLEAAKNGEFHTG